MLLETGRGWCLKLPLLCRWRCSWGRQEVLVPETSSVGAVLCWLCLGIRREHQRNHGCSLSQNDWVFRQHPRKLAYVDYRVRNQIWVWHRCCWEQSYCWRGVLQCFSWKWEAFVSGYWSIMSFLLLLRCFAPRLFPLYHSLIQLFSFRSQVLSVRVEAVKGCLLGVLVSFQIFLSVLFKESMTWVQLQGASIKNELQVLS